MNNKGILSVLLLGACLYAMEKERHTLFTLFDNQALSEKELLAMLITTHEKERITQEYNDARGNTLLHRAVEKNYLSIIQFFMSTAPSLVNIYNNEQFTPLHIAAWYDRHEAISIMLDHDKTDVNRPSALLQTPLHLAVINKSEQAVYVLLHHKNINTAAQDISHKTPIDYAQQDSIIFQFLTNTAPHSIASPTALAAVTLLFAYPKKNISVETEETE